MSTPTSPHRLRLHLAEHGWAFIRNAVTAEPLRALCDLGSKLERLDVKVSRQGLRVSDSATVPGKSFETLMRQWMYAWDYLEPRTADTILAIIDELVCQLDGPHVPFQDVLLHKAHVHAEFPWHTDAPYWPLDTDDGWICWVALDAMTQANGGLELASGSHRGPNWPAVDLHSGQSQSGVSLPALNSYVVVPTLQPGDALLFHSKCAHRSGINTTEEVRRAWAISWAKPHARWKLSTMPQHPVRNFIIDNSEVRKWSNNRYRHTLA